MATQHNKNAFAVVAGGSKGIGLGIATALAKRGYNLVLIARHSDKLEEAKNLLESKYNIIAERLPCDLSLENSADVITSFCSQRNLDIRILCNVAGLGGAKDYLTLPLSEIRYMIDLNMHSAVSLTYKMLQLLENKPGVYILNVASMAGFAPIPVKNIYSATKSAEIFFSRALRSQLKKKNINVSCLCPGPVFTKPEIVKDTIEKMGWLGKAMAMQPGDVGEVAVRSMLKGKFLIIPGTVTKMVSFFVRALPDRWLVSVYEKMIERSNGG